MRRGDEYTRTITVDDDDEWHTCAKLTNSAILGRGPLSFSPLPPPQTTRHFQGEKFNTSADGEEAWRGFTARIIRPPHGSVRLTGPCHEVSVDTSVRGYHGRGRHSHTQLDHVGPDSHTQPATSPPSCTVINLPRRWRICDKRLYLSASPWTRAWAPSPDIVNRNVNWFLPGNTRVVADTDKSTHSRDKPAFYMYILYFININNKKGIIMVICMCFTRVRSQRFYQSISKGGTQYASHHLVYAMMIKVTDATHNSEYTSKVYWSLVVAWCEQTTIVTQVPRWALTLVKNICQVNASRLMRQ